MVESAWGATRCKDGFFKRRFESLVGRRGAKKALYAVARSIGVAAYHVLERLEPYKEPELHTNPKKKERKVKNHIKRLEELGFEVSIKEKAITDTL